MAYERFIEKEGKRHGPYFYKNIRDKDGKVRSVYLGKKKSVHQVLKERSKGPLRLTIAVLFILLILISVLFFIQSRNLVLSRESAESLASFEVDQVLIKVLVKTGESLGKEIRVMNTGTKEGNIEVEASGLLNIAKIIDKEFTINPGQTKIVRINLSSFDMENSIEHAPGVYIGKVIVKSENFEKDIPIIVEIETKEVLFDSNLNPVSRDRKILHGSDMMVEVRLFNLQSIEATNVDMSYFVKDLNGNTIISERENIVIETQTSFFKTVKIPQNLRLGTYVFVAQASYGNSVGTGSYLFEVTGEEEKPVSGFILLDFVQFCRNDALCWTLSLIILLLIFTIGAYLYFFLGAYLYNKFFGVKLRLRKVKEKPIMVINEKEWRKESRLKEFFRNWEKKRKKRKEEKLRRIELEKKRKEWKKRRSSEENLKKLELEKRVREEKKQKIIEFFRNWRARKKREKYEKLRISLELERKKLRLKAENERLKFKEREDRLRYIELKKTLREEGKKREILEKRVRQAQRKRKLHEFLHRLMPHKEQISVKKESRLKKFFDNLKEKRTRKREEKLRKKLEITNEKLRLKAEKERQEIQLKKEKEELEKNAEQERQKQVQLAKKRRDEEWERKRARLKELFTNWKVRREKRKQEKLSEKLKWKEQKLRLKSEKDRMKEKRAKEKARQIKLEKNLMEEKKRRKIEKYQEGLVNKCNKLAKKGYKSIEKGRIRKAKKLYNKLMGLYFNLSSRYKKEVFSEINSLYEEIKKREAAALKEAEVKKSQLENKKIETEKKREKEDERLRIEAKKERERLELKKLKEQETARKIEKEELQKKEAIKKKEQEDKLREQEKRRREGERRKKLDEIKKFEEKTAKKKKSLFSLLFRRKEASKEKNKEIEIKEKAKPKNLEKQIVNIGKKFGESIESKPEEAGLLYKIGLLKPKEEKGSRLFIKCRDLIGKSYKHLHFGNRNKARKLYSKAKKIYERLEYEEKKKLYKRLMNSYNMQNK